MSGKNVDKSKGASGAADDDLEGVSDHETETDENVSDDESGKSVSRSSYKKAVSQAKAARERARLAEEKAAQLEQEKLAAEGNKDEQIKSLQAKLSVEQKKNKEIYGNMARKTLSAQVKAEAAKVGCIDPDAVMALADLSELEVDGETFEADPDAIKEMIGALKKSKPYLFSKPGPKINGKMPAGKTDDDAPEKEDLSKLTKDQIRERLRTLDKKS